MVPPEKSALVTATESASAVTCLRSLGSRNIRTIAASEVENAAAFSSRYCDESVVVPSPYENLGGYKDALLSIAQRTDVQTLIPTREVDAYLLSKYRSAFEKHVSPLWPSFETLGAVHDRLRLAEAATEVGIPVPETRLQSDVDNWNRDLIVKPRYSILTRSYVDSISPDQCARLKVVKYLPAGAEPDRETIDTEMRGVEPLVQEFVRAESEYSFAALCDRGTAVTTYQQRHIRGKTYAGGPSVYRKSVRVPRLEAYGRALLDHLEWHGLAEVQFMRDETTGEFKLLEVNPFVWGSVPCAVRAGADFPYDFWLLATGERDRIEPGYEEGIATHFLYGELQYLASVWRDDHPLVERPALGAAIWDVLSSIVTHPHFDHPRVDDPRPFVQGLRNVLPIGG